jgi:hypothetical protein
MKAVVYQVPGERAVAPVADPEPGLGEGRRPASGRDRRLRDGLACPKAALAP